ncbi:MAG: peptide ABC transporter substrate-binding protein [Pirellulales bacterium]
MPPTIRRRILSACVVAVILGAIWGATRLGSLPAADYVVVNNTEVETLDPAQSQGVPEGRVIWALFEGLCVPDAKDLSPQPGVAERWEISDDGKRYVFHLRPNAKWSDGTPLTAANIVWSMRRMLHPSTGGQYSYELWYVVNAGRYTKQELRAGDAVEIQVLQDGLSAADKQLAVDEPLDTDYDRANAPHALLRGKLIAIRGEKLFDIEIDGRVRTFDADVNRKPRLGEPAVYVLPDFESVAIRALDERTVEFRLENPTPYFLEVLAMYPFAPVQRACVAKHGHAWIKPGNLVSNGPYVLQQRRFRERIRVVKNPHYWDANNVALETVDFLSVNGQNTALNLYLTGQADWIEKVPGAVVADLPRLYPDDYRPAPYITTYFYRINVTNGPLKNKKLRQALNMAIDKSKICSDITRGGQTPARSFVSSVIDDHDPALCGPFDPAAARALLAEAKRELVTDGLLASETAPLRLKLQFNTLESHQAIAETIQIEWLSHLGIEAELNSLEWGAYQKNQNDLTYQISRAGWVGDYKDPMTFLKLFTSDSTQSNTGWKHPPYDELIARASRRGSGRAA